jgi:uncharacterized membrane protein
MILVMNKKYHWLIVLGLIALPFAYAFYLYPSLPSRIPIHFNIKGEADGWGSPESIFLGPAIMSFVSLFVFFIISNIKYLDPKRYADTNTDDYAVLGLGIVIFLSILSLSILYSVVNESLRDGKFVFVLVGLLFSGLGLYFNKVKQNYFVGLRLPWTLEDVANWNATHQFASKFWLIGGILISLIAILLKGVILLLVFFSIVLLMVFFPVMYSYRFFKKMKNK